MRKSLILLTNKAHKHLTRNICQLDRTHGRPEESLSSLNLNSNRTYAKRFYCEVPNMACWNCQKCTQRKNQFFCGECGCLQDANRKYNYFQLMSLDNGFNVNAQDLTTKFRQLQSLLHPDKYSNKSEREQTNSLEWSSLVNKAYKILSVPIDRGEYILKQQGVTLPEDNSVLDKDFLMEMMEKNEEVDDATKDNILELMERVENDLTDSALDLEKSFSDNDLNQAKFILIRMKYLKSLEKNIKEKAVKLGAVK